MNPYYIVLFAPSIEPQLRELAKIFAEMIDEAPRDAAQALRAIGATPNTAFTFGLVPRALPDMLAYNITRWKNITLQGRVYDRTRTHPEKIKNFLLKRVRKQLGPDYDVEKHFTPSYNPWDQRLCLIPDGDLYKAINSGKASVVTDKIECITKKGIRLESGEELDADIIVVATGLNMKLLGGTQFEVDGAPVQFPETFTYKGMLYSDVPNLVQTFGYINASWTLRADLIAEFVCRLLNHMDELGQRQCTAQLREEDSDMETRPWIDDFSAGYIQRKMRLFPKQGDHLPWLNTQNYSLDKKLIRKAPLEDGVLQFTSPIEQQEVA